MQLTSHSLRELGAGAITYEDYVAAVRQDDRAYLKQGQAAELRAENERIQRHRDAEQAATDADQERRRLEGERRRMAQRAWAARGDELRDRGDSNRSALADARAKMQSPDLNEAWLGTVDVLVFEMRLRAAQDELDAHMRAQPRYLS